MLLKFARRNKMATIIFSLIVSGLISLGLHQMWPVLAVLLISILSLV